MSTLPHAAHGDTLPIVKIIPKYEGKGDARHIIGSELTAMLLFDNCKHAPIVIRGLEATKLPTPEVVMERNLKMDFLKARFTDLVITYRGGDFGAVIYNGTASGVEFLNLTPAPGNSAGK